MNDEYKNHVSSYLGVRVERAKDESETKRVPMTLLLFCLQS